MMGFDKNSVVPIAVNTLISGLVTFTNWTGLLLLDYERPSFLIAVIASVIGCILALQFNERNAKLVILLGLIFCIAVLGYYRIWDMNGAAPYIIYLGVFLIFPIFTIGSYFLTLLLILVADRSNK